MMKMLSRAALACLVLMQNMILPAGEATITFPPRPRLAHTRAELDAWTADSTRARERERALKAADDLVAKGPLYVPKKEGQWVFYYCNRETGDSLEAKSLTEHWCPATKTWHNDERTVAAYRTVLGNLLNENCFRLAVAYGLTGDERYARPVREALLELAALFPTFERHDRWGRRGLLAVVGGRRYCQHLSEAVGAMRLAEAYDLVCEAPCFSEADRAVIEKDFFRATVNEILLYGRFAGTRNNHRTFFNAAFMMVGVALGDSALVRESLHGAYGLHWQLENSITADGIWYEGTMSYHMYALSALMQHADAARRIGVDLSSNAKFKSLWTGPLQLAYPNGQFPAINDSDRTTLAVYRGTYAWGHRFFNEPLFAAYAGTNAPGTDGAGTPQLQPESRDLSGIGLANLRVGSGDGAACVFIDYGIHGEGHGHPDKLNLMLYALGRELFPDIGRITYQVPEYRSWARQTIAHNTVVVNGRSQQPTTGKVLFFEAGNGHAAALTQSDDAYPGWDLRRFTILTERHLVDVFRVSGARRGRIDWALHGFGTLLPPEGAGDAAYDKPLGTSEGYQHLADIRRIDAPETAAFRFDLTKGKDVTVLPVHVMDSPAVTRFIATGIGYSVRERLPMLVRRVTAKEALFITVVDLSETGDGITRVERFPIAVDSAPAISPNDAVGLRLTEAGGVTEYRMGLKEPLPTEGDVPQTMDLWLRTAKFPVK